MTMGELLNDILKVYDPEAHGESRYSLARLSLLIYVIISVFTLLLPFFTNISDSTYDIMVNMVIMLLFLFSGYSFGNQAVASLSETRKKIHENNSKG